MKDTELLTDDLLSDNNLHDDLLTALFSGFRPPLTDDNGFLRRVEHSLDSVEFVRRHNDAWRRRNRIALFVAALTGILTGSILTLVFPWLDSMPDIYGTALYRQFLMPTLCRSQGRLRPISLPARLFCMRRSYG